MSTLDKDAFAPVPSSVVPDRCFTTSTGNGHDESLQQVRRRVGYKGESEQKHDDERKLRKGLDTGRYFNRRQSFAPKEQADEPRRQSTTADEHRYKFAPNAGNELKINIRDRLQEHFASRSIA